MSDDTLEKGGTMPTMTKAEFLNNFPTEDLTVLPNGNIRFTPSTAKALKLMEQHNLSMMRGIIPEVMPHLRCVTNNSNGDRGSTT